MKHTSAVDRGNRDIKKSLQKSVLELQPVFLYSLKFYDTTQFQAFHSSLKWPKSFRVFSIQKIKILHIIVVQKWPQLGSKVKQGTCLYELFLLLLYPLFTIDVGPNMLRNTLHRKIKKLITIIFLNDRSKDLSCYFI